MKDENGQIEDTKRDIARMKKHERDPLTFRDMLVYGSMSGLLFVVPVIFGAYLGRWIDSISEGYSVRWTMNLIILGIFLGAYNVYRFMKDRT
jgi:ATP synthase protein I